MRIISRGEVPDLKPIRFECNYCKTVFEATRQEASLVSDQRDGNFWTCLCPVCTRGATKDARS